jgi:hypothetical protein
MEPTPLARMAQAEPYTQLPLFPTHHLIADNLVVAPRSGWRGHHFDTPFMSRANGVLGPTHMVAQPIVGGVVTHIVG